jgi:predicted pyridoxine 5'-phosphate oxidase superfamily flavin-nucleotide-binding protein
MLQGQETKANIDIGGYMKQINLVGIDVSAKELVVKIEKDGKKPLQAIIAVMRKLLLAIWGMFKSETIWKDEKFSNIKKIILYF